MKLNGDVIYGFVNALLLSKFDNPQPIPEFHKDIWDYCTHPKKFVAITAPRGHAKSTAVSFSYLLCSMLFRDSTFAILISNTEPQAIQFLTDIKVELTENEEIRNLFNIRRLIKDNERDIICEMGPDRHKFRIMVKPASAIWSIRGTKWRNKRPDLIIGDDLEDDETVMNDDRREKFRQTMFNTVVPALSDKGKIRLVGTILHFDSFLERLMPQTVGRGSEFTKIEPLRIYSTDPKRVWHSIKFRAHPSLNDFSSILWEDKFSEQRLKEIRETYIVQGYSEGYSQEYLNNPIDETVAFFRKEDFVPMSESDFTSRKTYYAAIDFAISLADRADYTVIVVVGMDEEGYLHVVDVYRGRWDSKEIIDKMLYVQQRYNPDLFVTEKGSIEKSIGPFLRDEMFRRSNSFINLWPMQPTQDKRSRARAIQGRMRQKGVKFDLKALWFPEFEQELLRFDRGEHDDQVDALAWIGLVLNQLNEAPTQKMIDDTEYEQLINASDVDLELAGRNKVTGY